MRLNQGPIETVEAIAVSIEARNRIGDTWSDAGATAEAASPARPGRLIGTYPLSAAAAAVEAVEAAAAALPAWRARAGPDRGNILYAAADALAAHARELADVSCLEMGKPIGEARGEADRAVAIFRFYAGEASRPVGEVIPSQRAGTLQYTQRVPLGVVAAITPWNFPLAIPAWKIAPALAYGNTVVLKPAEWSSLTAFRLVAVLADGLPPGVLNLVMGLGREAGDALVRSPGVAGITFTGSATTGRAVAEAALTHGAKYQLEMGGKNPVIVAADADLELAADLTVSGAMRSAGQKCTATSRAIALAPVREAFGDAVRRRIEALRVGDPADPDTYVGPVVSRPQYEKVLALVAQGRQEGARVLAGGGPHAAADGGYFVAPTLFDAVTPDMTIFQEEIFGPVVGISEALDLDDAVRQANAVRYGLSASVFTRSLDTALRVVDALDAGLVRVNEESAGVELQAPFGGMKASSSHSREQGRAAMDFFTDTKTVAMRAG